MHAVMNFVVCGLCAVYINFISYFEFARQNMWFFGACSVIYGTFY